MYPEIIDSKYITDYKLWLKFDDGKEGEIDLKDELWGEVFEPLNDVNYFKTVRLDRELGTICWENGADFAPEFLYDNLKTNYIAQLWEQSNIEKMSIEERLLLIETIWGSVVAQQEKWEMTEELKAELDRRIEAYRSSPDEGIAWEVVKAKLISKKEE